MSDRRHAEAAGRRAEWVALLYLRIKGYRLIERRFRCPQGEIDLIVRRGRVLAFVEVKYRREEAAAAEAIAAQQQARIARAASVFLQVRSTMGDLTPRFDAMLMVPGRWPRHIINAFQADW